MNKSPIKFKKHISLKSRFRCAALFFIIIVLFTGQIKAQENVNLTWAGAINRALTENPNLGSAEASLEASRANIAIARAEYLPGITIAGSVSESKAATFSDSQGILPSSSALVGASLSQMVYNEKFLANHKIQKFLHASQEEQFRNTSYSTISLTGQAYIGLLFANDLLGVQEENLKITEKNLQAAKDRQEVGSTDMQEVLRWATQLYANKQTVTSQKASVVSSRAQLNQILNLPLETIDNLEILTMEKDGFIFSNQAVAALITDEIKARLVRDYLVELGMENSPILASIDQEILAQDRQLKSDQRWAIPSFGFQAGVDAKFAPENDNSPFPGTNDKDFWKVGLSMAWPLVDGGANINKAKQSKSQMSAIELQKNNVKSSLEQNIRSAVAIIISDFINVDFSNMQAEFAQQNYDLVYDSYLVGESNLLDLLDAQDQKLGADISSRVSLYTFFIDMLIMEQTIGYFPFLKPKDEVATVLNDLENQLLGQ